MKKNILENCSWQEVSEMKREDRIVLIPLGSTEQQGAHLPLAVDTYVAVKVAKDVSQKTGALVSPALTVGYSGWFMEYPGTITFSFETFIQMMREYCESLITHGFKKLVFINGHGGNSPAIDLVGRELKMRFDLTVATIEIWPAVNSLAKKCEFLKEKSFTHGGEAMTSILMAIDPEIVDMKRARVEYLKSTKPPFEIKGTLGPAEFEGIPIKFYEKAMRLTVSGIMGDPTAASPEAGKWLLNELVSFVERIIHKL